MLDKPIAKDAQGVAKRRAAFEDAIHSLKMEDVDLDLKEVPELQAVIAGTMSFDEAEQAIFEQFAYRK